MTGGLPGGMPPDLNFFATGDLSVQLKDLEKSEQPPDRCVGLGQGVGGNLARSCLGLVGSKETKEHRVQQATKDEKKGDAIVPLDRLNAPFSPSTSPRSGLTGAILSYSEPKGMWFSLLMNDMGPVPREELDKVIAHRWTFQGALELAAQGKSICYFILCLLEIQRNIQVDQEEEVLNANLLEALNPDGVAAGRTRTNLESVDLNRHHHDDAAAETKGLRAALQAESQRGELLAFIDIHSHSKRRGIFAIANGNDADRLVSLLANRTPLLDLQGTNRTETRPQDVGVGRVAAAAQGYKYSLTIESSLCARHLAIGGEHLLLQDLASVGRAICFAVTDLLYPENEPVEVICAKGDDDLDEDADAAEDEGFRVFTPE